MPANPTIYDVSRLSGVSTATVSRAFSDPERVRESTRRKVYEAAEVLHYSPNAIARAMARQRTDKIAYLICKKGATILDEFYAGICEGIMRTANRADYQLLVSTAEDWQLTVSTAQNKQIEGVILGGDAQAGLVSDFQSQNVAVVLVNNRMPGFDLPCVVSDERGGVFQAVEHLISKGHRRIAMITGRFSPYIAGERYTAFLDVMRSHNLPVNAADLKMCDLDVESATQAALELLVRPDRPTAVFSANDVIAASVIKAARRLGLRLPEDLAVVGFDDSSICTLLEPELTSVHTNCRRMGELCMERLKALLDEEPDIPRITTLPTELTVRRSS
jgi:DNA-binding LacI/PurR family transcriptional regulator